jgi:hypothetical protein
MTLDSAIAPRIPSVGARAVLAICIAAAMLAGCDTDIGDQSCTESSLERDLEDECPFGPPGGPAVSISGDTFCVDPPDFTNQGPACETEYTWGRVFEIFNEPNQAIGGGNCTSANCHGVATKGDVPKSQPALYAADAQATHDALQEYGMTRYGRPYIRSQDAPELPGKPEEAWIMCNLRSLRGLLMPPTGFKPSPDGTDPLEIIRGWVDCGMKFSLGGGTGAAGGAGGAGGGVGGDAVAGAGGI